MKENSSLFEQLEALRGHDHYPSPEIKDYLIQLYLPTSVSDLASNLSNITSQFYALQLQSIGTTYGVDQIRVQSDKLFYQLGLAKAEQALAKDPMITRDCRALILVVISAIYTSSPEFKFSVEAFTPNHAVIVLRGVDRYHRAAKKYQIDSYLSFPTLLPFMEGVRDYFQFENMSIQAFPSSYDENSTIECVYSFKIE